MIIFPAIDIKDNKCVRLTQGDFDKVNIYSEDPYLMAKKWVECGAKFIHVVNLNGSRDEVKNSNISRYTNPSWRWN